MEEGRGFTRQNQCTPTSTGTRQNTKNGILEGYDIGVERKKERKKVSQMKKEGVDYIVYLFLSLSCGVVWCGVSIDVHDCVRSLLELES